MLKGEIKKKNNDIKKLHESTDQICDPGYETEITS